MAAARTDEKRERAPPTSAAHCRVPTAGSERRGRPLGASSHRHRRRRHRGQHRQHAAVAGATASAPRQLARRPTRHRAPLPGDPGAAPFRPARREPAPPRCLLPHPVPWGRCTPTPPPPAALPQRQTPRRRLLRPRNWATVRAREMSRVSPRRRKAKVYGGGGGGTSAVCCGLYRVRVRALARLYYYYYYYCNTVTDRARAANVIFSRYSARVGSLRTDGRTDGRTNERTAGGGTRR